MIDVRPGHHRTLLPRRWNHPVQYLARLPDRDEMPAGAIAIGVYPGRDGDRGTELAAWAQSAAIPVLSVAVYDENSFLGPLTIPGRVGCGHCARQRIRAAAAIRCSADAPAGGTGEPEPSNVARRVIARELAALCASDPGRSPLLDHVLVVNGEAGDVTRHRVIPLSRCPVCGGVATLSEPARHGVNDNLPDASPLAGWVDPVTGVIPELSLDPASTDHSSPIVVTAAPPHVVDDDGTLRRLPVGWGKGLTPGDAVRSAVGEALERYSASVPDPARIVWQRPDELDGDCLNPRLFTFYTEEQYVRAEFPYARFDPDVRHPWVRGRWLGTGTDVWIPAVVVFLSLTIEPEHLICQGTSNGLAASTSLDDAAFRATLELVERDALMVAWLTGTCGQRLRIDESLEPRLAAVVDGVEALGNSFELYLLPTSAYGTTAMCLALGDGDNWPGVTIGLAADIDPTAAVRRAILELGQTGPHLRQLLRTEALVVPKDAASVRTMLDHAAFYFPPERAAAFAGLRAGGKTVPLASLEPFDGERSLAACASALNDAGIRVALVDVTSPDVATGPFRVVRAVSPDLQPISYGYELGRAPVDRIRMLLPASGSPPIHPVW